MHSEPKQPLFREANVAAKDVAAKDVAAKDVVAEGLNRPLDGYSFNDLLTLRSKIDERLPASKLADLDIEKELVIQYIRTKALQEKVLDDGDTPANQQAQVANSCAGAIAKLLELQNSKHTSERFKKLEGILLRAVKGLPNEVMEKFFADYEAMEAGA